MVQFILKNLAFPQMLLWNKQSRFKRDYRKPSD